MVIPFLVQFAIQAVMTIASIADQRRRANRARREAAARAEAAKGLLIPTEGESAPLPVYYGRNAMGGSRVYHNTFNNYNYSLPSPLVFQGFDSGGNMGGSIAGDKHEFLVFQQAVAYGGLGTPKFVLINEKPYNTTEYQHGGLVNFCSNGSVADPIMTATDATRVNALFTNAAYFTGIFRLNRDEPQFNGVPSVQVIGDGNLVRTINGSLGARVMSSTKIQSNNPALVLIDYLTNSIYGRGLADSKLDLDTFHEAYLICEKVVLSAVAKEGYYWSSTAGNRDIKLYECNIGLDSSKAIRDNIELILETMAGAELIWTGGKYKLKLIYPTVWAAGTYLLNDIVQHTIGVSTDLYRCQVAATTQTPGDINWARDVISAYITDSDIIRKGENSIAWPSAQTRLNYVTVRFLNEAKDFAEDSVSWPPKTGSVYTAFKSEDYNIPLETDFFESGTTDYYHAMAKAEQRCRASRNAVVYKFNVGAHLSGLEPADLIKVDSSVLGIPGEVMTIEEIKILQDGNAELQCVKFDARQLAWNANDAEVVVPRNIYSTVIEQASSLVYNPVNLEQTGSSGLLTWNNAADIRVQSYKIKITDDIVIDSSTVWKEIGVISRQTNSPTTQYSLPALDSGTYTIAVVSCTFNKIAERDSWPTLEIDTPIVSEAEPAQTLLRIYQRATTTPATPTGGSFNFSTYLLSSIPVGWLATIPQGNDNVYMTEAVAVDPGASGVDSTLTWGTPTLFLGGTITAYLSEPVVGVSQNLSGTNIYTAAIGRFNVFRGSVDVTENSGPVFSIVSLDGVTMTLSNALDSTKGDYAITGLTKDKGSAILRVVHQGVTIEQTLSVVLVGAAKIRDLTAPPIPTGVTAVSTTTTTYISQATPGYSVGHGHAYTEVWASASNAVGTATKLDQFAGNNYNIPIPINTPRYLWFKWVSQDGIAGPISAASINVSSTTIQTVDLATGAVTTVKLADNSVTQGKYSTADINNLIFNPDFATGDTRSWNRVSLFGGGAIDVVPNATGGVPGGASTNNILRIAHSGNTETSITSSDGNFNTSGLVGGTPVTAGENFFVAIEAASSIAGTGLLIDIVFKTASGAITSLTALTPNLTTGWASYNNSFQSAVTGRMYLRIGHYAGSAKTSFITNVRLYKRNTADLIVDGAIIANKLAVNAVAAGNIQADAITSIKIAADQITATHMAVDSITAANGAIADLAVTNAKIAGAIQSDDFVAGVSGWQIDKAGDAEFNDATFRGNLDVKNATSGARLEIRNNVIKVFDSTGALRVQIGDLTA